MPSGWIEVRTPGPHHTAQDELWNVPNELGYPQGLF